MKTLVYGAAGVAFLMIGCHSITEELPTQPTGTPAGGVLTVPIPKIPVGSPKPSPTPTPSSSPTPTPTPTPNPGKNGCGDPVPSEVSVIGVKVHLKGVKWTLDSTPKVGPDAEYCRKIGYTDGRSYCPVRTETAKDRGACETLIVGTAKDTGRTGPTWYRNGKFCTGEASGCENHPENQYLLWVYTSGTYQACAKNGVCGTEDVVK